MIDEPNFSLNAPVSLADIPAQLEPVSQIYPHGAAAEWLQKRGIWDLDRLWERWQVFHTDEYPIRESRSRHPAFVFPIRYPVPVDEQFARLTGRSFETRILGWEAQLYDASPKVQQTYIITPSAIQYACVYGLPEAMDGDGAVLVCSWPLDCWSSRLDSIAIMGRWITERKLQAITDHLEGRDLVVLAHADKPGIALDWHSVLSEERQRTADTAKVLIGKLPSGRPYPSQCSEQELADSIGEALSDPGDLKLADADTMPSRRDNDRTSNWYLNS